MVQASLTKAYSGTKKKKTYSWTSSPSNSTANAVIYCRVSSTKQMTEGDGLASQENNCRNYAQTRGYVVCAVFRDGVSGGTDNRKGLQQMLDFLQSQGEGMVVIIDDLKRFAREVEVHFDLKRIITDCGARLESPLFRFEDSPEGKFVETIVAAQAELERNQNKRQVVSRMRARLEMGYWVFKAPPGYSFERHPTAKKLLVPNELAPLVREALEGYASARFIRVSDVVHFLEANGFFQKGSRAQGTRHGRVQEMLESVIYSGWVEYAPWDVSLRQGHHEPLISLTNYHKIQERLHGKVGATKELPRHREFSLRGTVRCGTCGYPLTAYHSRGGSGKEYSYYHCWKQGCSERGKAIRETVLEGVIEELLAQLTMTEEGLGTAVDWLVEQERSEGQRRRETLTRLGVQLSVLARQEEDLITSISRTQITQVHQALETKLISLLQEREKLDGQRAQLSAGHTSNGEGGESVRTIVAEVEEYLRNPLQIWQTGDTKKRQLVARVAFPESLYWEREKGVRTASFRLCYRIIREVVEGKSDLVDLTPICSNSDTLSYDLIIHELRSLVQLVRDGNQAENDSDRAGRTAVAVPKRDLRRAELVAESPRGAELVVRGRGSSRKHCAWQPEAA